jgi:hypothetical protein
LAADIASESADVDALIAEAQLLAAKLASGSISSDELEAVRQPILTAFGSAREKNSWWASAMNGSARKPEIVDELMGYQQLMTSITLDEVKSAASKWLSAKPIIGISLPRSSAQTAAAKSTGARAIHGKNSGANR